MSSGTSGSESAFLDASENGDDVFFITTSKLVSADYDKGYDVYDAHVCTTMVPCVTPPESPPECSSGDACKPAPSPQPELFGPAPSATFTGAGNVVVAAPQAKSQPISRAQRLAMALKRCRRKADKHKRANCELRAKQLYGARRGRSARERSRS